MGIILLELKYYIESKAKKKGCYNFVSTGWINILAMASGDMGWGLKPVHQNRTQIAKQLFGIFLRKSDQIFHHYIDTAAQ